MLDEADADGFATKLAAATGRAVRDYGDEDVVNEEPFSDQLCGRLKETLESFKTANIDWQVDVAQASLGRGRLRARTLAKHKEEPDLGADLVMTLDIDTPTYSVRKGFLAQAKRLQPGKLLSNEKHRELIGQCDRMLSVTPASMVFLYSTEEVTVVPAAAVMALRHTNLWKIVTYEIEILYRDFAICWFGDPRLQSTDRQSLEGLRAATGANAALRFSGRQIR